jgi:hypothetical protein
VAPSARAKAINPISGLTILTEILTPILLASVSATLIASSAALTVIVETDLVVLIKYSPKLLLFSL